MFINHEDLLSKICFSVMVVVLCAIVLFIAIALVVNLGWVGAGIIAIFITAVVTVFLVLDD